MRGIGRQAIGTMGILIGVYLVAGNLTGWGKLLTSAGTAGGGFVKNLQGRG